MEERDAAVGSHLRVDFFFSSGSRQMLLGESDGQRDRNEKTNVPSTCLPSQARTSRAEGAWAGASSDSSDARATTAVTGVEGTYGRPMAAVVNVIKQVYLNAVGMRLTFGGGWR